MKHNDSPKTELNISASHELPSKRPGPRTAQAKERTRHNAVTHGFFADLVLSGDELKESREQYLRLLSSLRKTIMPVGALEEVLVEKLAFLFLRLTRVYRADWRVAPLLFERVAATLGEDHEPLITTWINKEDEVVFLRKAPGPELLLRYESSLERQIDRILGQLERLGTMRQGLPVPPPIKVDVCT